MQLAGSVIASKVDHLHLEHEAQVRDQRAQAGKVSGLEAELAKVNDVESTLHLEFEQRLVKEKEELSVKYDTKVGELRMAQDAKNK
jgi:hypothetical protein